MRRATRQRHISPDLLAPLRLRLPKFVVLILRKRAKTKRQTLSEVTEAAILEDVLLDEVRHMANASPAFATAFKAWFREAMRPRT